jgi:hypothetical protein
LRTKCDWKIYLDAVYQSSSIVVRPQDSCPSQKLLA